MQKKEIWQAIDDYLRKAKLKRGQEGKQLQDNFELREHDGLQKSQNTTMISINDFTSYVKYESSKSFRIQSKVIDLNLECANLKMIDSLNFSQQIKKQPLGQEVNVNALKEYLQLPFIDFSSIKANLQTTYQRLFYLSQKLYQINLPKICDKIDLDSSFNSLLSITQQSKSDRIQHYYINRMRNVIQKHDKQLEFQQFYYSKLAVFMQTWIDQIKNQLPKLNPVEHNWKRQIYFLPNGSSQRDNNHAEQESLREDSNKSLSSNERGISDQSQMELSWQYRST